MPSELCERYFLKGQDSYRVRSDIRKMVVFAPHNVLSDAPFTGVDLVSCRNLLIYLRPSAQNRALTLFHYSLRVGGVLLLGNSESVGELGREFKVISQRHRLFRKARDIKLIHHLRSPIAAATMSTVPAPVVPRTTETRSQDVYSAIARTPYAAERADR